jgi:hypothetical protein
MPLHPTKNWSDLHWDLKSPCADCPFRKSTPFHQGVAEGSPDLINSMISGTFAHTCHKTDPRADSEHGKRHTGKLQHCIGALFMLIKTGRGRDLQIPLLRAAEESRLDVHELCKNANADEDCFTLREFIDFQAEGLDRVLLRSRNRRRSKRAV